jgi:hypothetical protein
MDFDKCHNLSKRNFKLILKILSDLDPSRGSSNKKNLAFNSFVCQLGFFGARGKNPNLHKNSLNILLQLTDAESFFKHCEIGKRK